MPSRLRDAIAALEQIQAGMIEGRVATSSELDPVRERALAATHAEICAAIDTGAAHAEAMLKSIPLWARSLLDPSLFAALEEAAAKHVAPVPETVVEPGFGAFSWEDDRYVSERPVSAGAVSVWLSLDDIDPDGVAERLRAHAWVRSRLEDVVKAACHYAAAQGLEMHNAGYADPAAGLTTEAQFRARLTPTHISLEPERATIHFDDGDLSWGHDLTVVCDRTGRPLDLLMSG